MCKGWSSPRSEVFECERNVCGSVKHGFVSSYLAHAHVVMAFSAGMDVLFAFAISYSIPYLLGTPGANLSARVGFVFMGWCAGTWILTYLLVPEVTGRSLEEVDELFSVRIVSRQASGTA